MIKIGATRVQKQFSSTENYSAPVALKRESHAGGRVKRPPLGPSRVSASGAWSSSCLRMEVGNLRLRAAEPVAQRVKWWDFKATSLFPRQADFNSVVKIIQFIHYALSGRKLPCIKHPYYAKDEITGLLFGVNTARW